MRKYLVLMFVVPLSHCGPTEKVAEAPPDLSSPDAVIQTNYAAFRAGDMQLLQAVYVDDVKTWISQEKLAELGKLLEGVRIVEVSPMKDVEGEMFVKVEETWRGNPTPSMKYYVLRQTDSGWRIVSFNVEEGIEPFDPQTLDDRLMTPR
jgi:hypothetical protein